MHVDGSKGGTMIRIHPTAIVSPEAHLGEGVEIGPYCVIGANVSIGDGTRLISHVVIDGHTSVGRNCVLFPFACIGTQTQDLKYKGGTTYVEIGDRTTLREYVTINSATNEGDVTRVGSDCHICAYAHVAHACRVGNEVIMSNAIALAGEVVVEDQAVLGGLSAVHQFTRIGRLCMIGGCSAIRQDCPPFMLVAGNPAEVAGVNTVGMTRKNIAEEIQRHIKEAYKLLYRSGLSTRQAVDRIKKEIPLGPEISHLIAFIESSQRGITR